MSIAKPALLLACPALLLVALVSGCDGPSRTEQLEFTETITSIEVDTGAGDIVVVADEGRDRIEVEAVIRGDKTRLRWTIDDQTLHLDHRCPPTSFGSCAVDWYVWVPRDASGAGLDLDLESGSGDIAVDNLLGNLRAATGSGEVSLRDVVGFAFDLETGSGDVSLARCEADDVEAETGSGDVDVTLASKPRRVALETGSGDVRLSVPADDYLLDLDTGSGDVEVHGLDHDPGAESLIAISTGSGNIVVHGS